MSSLTVTEAHTRATSVCVQTYDVELDLTLGDRTFGSRTVVAFESRDHQDTWVDVQPHELASVRLNDEPLDVGELRDGRLHLTSLDDHNVLVVDAVMSYSHDGEGLHRAVDPEDGLAYLYAMTFLPAAPRVFACFDQPDLKARYGVRVKAPANWTVLGNGRSTQVEPGVWRLADTEPLSTYFVTLVAGPYHSITRVHDGITLGLHCRQSLAPHLDKDTDELFEVTGECFDEYHRLFGIRYPFGDYHQVFVPEFNAGAMENPGCVTFTDDFVFKAQATDTLRASRTYVIAHEMAHQWFGNLVTMRWWDDLWLNESFATYMGYRVTSQVTRFDDIWVQFAYDEKAWGLAADQRRSTHPVAGNGARDTQQALTDFDGISYSKGAATLRQLNTYLGDGPFVAGVQDHLHRHSYGNATLADLLESWQRASDNDVGAWSNAWLRTAGVDSITCALGDSGDVVVERTNGSVEDVARPHAFNVTWYRDDGGSTTTSLLLTAGSAAVDLPSYDGTGLILPDSGDETWTKIALDEASRRRAARFLTTIEDPLGRAVIWGSLREALSDASISPDHYLATVEEALPGETDLAVEKILGPDGGGGVIGHLGTFFTAAEHRQRLTTVAERLLHDAEPATNRQLIAARALVALSDDESWLRSWLAGGAPQGLRTDEDLRWRITRALCERGAMTMHDIEAERGRDPSSQGAEHALRCKAALPDPDVKSEVWGAITTDASLSNVALYALAECFFRPDQEALTAPYVQRYFAELPDTANIRTGMVVESSANRAFPRFAVNAETVRLSEECLGRDGLTPGPRRVISDRTDDLRRVLASHVAFPGGAGDGAS